MEQSEFPIRISDLQRQIAELPVGSVTRKSINGKEYFYHRWSEGIYSWWSYRFSARAKNAGWRIDYFCVSESLKDRLYGASIHTQVMGSDHCPVELDLLDKGEEKA